MQNVGGVPRHLTLWNQMFSFSGLKVSHRIGMAADRCPKELSYEISEHVVSLCDEGRLKDAVGILNKLGIAANFNAYATLLHGCAKIKALAEGKLVHAHMIMTRFDLNFFVENHLLNMYAKCGELEDARQVFDQMPVRNVVSWTAAITGYEQQGISEEALSLFSQMHRGTSDKGMEEKPLNSSLKF